jgi:hypothetical protein
MYTLGFTLFKCFLLPHFDATNWNAVIMTMMIALESLKIIKSDT